MKKPTKKLPKANPHFTDLSSSEIARVHGGEGTSTLSQADLLKLQKEMQDAAAQQQAVNNQIKTSNEQTMETIRNIRV